MGDAGLESVRLVFHSSLHSLLLISACSYIVETVHKDEQRYLPHVMQNPFMADVEVAEVFRSDVITGGAVMIQGQLGGMDDIL